MSAENISSTYTGPTDLTIAVMANNGSDPVKFLITMMSLLYKNLATIDKARMLYDLLAKDKLVYDMINYLFSNMDVTVDTSAEKAKMIRFRTMIKNKLRRQESSDESTTDVSSTDDDSSFDDSSFDSSSYGGLRIKGANIDLLTDDELNEIETSQRQPLTEETITKRFYHVVHAVLTLYERTLNQKPFTVDTIIQFFDNLMNIFGATPITKDDFASGQQPTKILIAVDRRISKDEGREETLILPHTQQPLMYKDIDTSFINKSLTIFYTIIRNKELTPFISEAKIIKAKANYRLPVMRNIVIQACDTGFITMLDDDDLSCDIPHMLELNESFIKKMNDELVACEYRCAQMINAGYSQCNNLTYKIANDDIELVLEKDFDYDLGGNGVWGRIINVANYIKYCASVNPGFTDGEDALIWRLLNELNSGTIDHSIKIETPKDKMVKYIYLAASHTCDEDVFVDYSKFRRSESRILLQYIYKRFNVHSLIEKINPEYLYEYDLKPDPSVLMPPAIRHVLYDGVCLIGEETFKHDLATNVVGDKCYWACCCSTDASNEVKLRVGIDKLLMTNYILENVQKIFTDVSKPIFDNITYELKRIIALIKGYKYQYEGEQLLNKFVEKWLDAITRFIKNEYGARVEFVFSDNKWLKSMILHVKIQPREVQLVGDKVRLRNGELVSWQDWNNSIYEKISSSMTDVKLDDVKTWYILDIMNNPPFRLRTEIIKIKIIEAFVKRVNVAMRDVREKYKKALKELKDLPSTASNELIQKMLENVASNDPNAAMDRYHKEYIELMLPILVDKVEIRAALNTLNQNKEKHGRPVHCTYPLFETVFGSREIDFLTLLNDETFKQYLLSKNFLIKLLNERVSTTTFENKEDDYKKYQDFRSTMFAGNRSEVWSIIIWLLIIVIVIVVITIIVKYINSRTDASKDDVETNS